MKATTRSGQKAIRYVYHIGWVLEPSVYVEAQEANWGHSQVHRKVYLYSLSLRNVYSLSWACTRAHTHTHIHRFSVEYFCSQCGLSFAHGRPDVASQKFKRSWGKVGRYLRMGKIWTRPRKVSHGRGSTSIRKVRKAESDTEKQEFWETCDWRFLSSV